MNNGKLTAIVSYIGPIGWIVALILHLNEKTSLGAYHLRQTLGWMIVTVVIIAIAAALLVIPVLGAIIFIVAWAALLVLWLIGLIAAIQGQQTPMPIIGAKIQSLLSGVFA